MLFYTSNMPLEEENSMLVNFKFTDRSESLSSHTGLALVGALLERCSNPEILSKLVFESKLNWNILK